MSSHHSNITFNSENVMQLGEVRLWLHITCWPKLKRYQNYQRLRVLEFLEDVWEYYSPLVTNMNIDSLQNFIIFFQSYDLTKCIANLACTYELARFEYALLTKIMKPKLCILSVSKLSKQVKIVLLRVGLSKSLDHQHLSSSMHTAPASIWL